VAETHRVVHLSLYDSFSAMLPAAGAPPDRFGEFPYAISAAEENILK
jgi:hypothetical protein